MFLCGSQRSAADGPAWQPDSATSVCMRCQGSFKLLLVRRHHCRLCGDVVCGDCSTSRVHRKRACDNCVLNRLRANRGSGLTTAKTAFGDDGWQVVRAQGPDPQSTQRAQFAYDADGNLRAVEDYEYDSGGVTSSADSLSSVVEAYVARQ